MTRSIRTPHDVLKPCFRRPRPWWTATLFRSQRLHCPRRKAQATPQQSTPLACQPRALSGVAGARDRMPRPRAIENLSRLSRVRRASVPAARADEGREAYSSWTVALMRSPIHPSAVSMHVGVGEAAVLRSLIEPARGRSRPCVTRHFQVARQARSQRSTTAANSAGEVLCTWCPPGMVTSSQHGMRAATCARFS